MIYKFCGMTERSWKWQFKFGHLVGVTPVQATVESSSPSTVLSPISCTPPRARRARNFFLVFLFFAPPSSWVKNRIAWFLKFCTPLWRIFNFLYTPSQVQFQGPASHVSSDTASGTTTTTKENSILRACRAPILLVVVVPPLAVPVLRI